MSNFEPAGPEARWKIIFRLAERLPVDGILSYEVLDRELGISFKDDRGGLDRAMAELEEKRHRTLVNVRNVGYRVARASEHAKLAAGHHKRSRRQLAKAIGRASSARREELTVEEARRVDAMEISLRQYADMTRRLEGRVTRTEKGLRDVRREQSASTAVQSDRLDRLVEALRRHGIEVDETSDTEAPAS